MGRLYAEKAKASGSEKQEAKAHRDLEEGRIFTVRGDVKAAHIGTLEPPWPDTSV